MTRITDSAASPDHRLPVDPVKSRLARPGSASRRQLRDSARWAPCTAPGPHPAGSIASAADSPLDMERKIQGAPGRLPRLRTGRSGGAGTAGCRLCTRRRLRLNRPRAARAVHRRRLLTYRVRRLGRTCSALLLFSGFVGAPPLACAQLSAQRHTESAEQGAEAPASEIVTDRPDITEASTVVPYGSLQAENGPVWTTRQHLRTLDGLETRLRFGIARRTEQRLGVPDCFYDRGRPEHASGFGDLIVGAKQQLGPLPGDFQLSMIGAVSLPTGTSGASSGGVDPEIKFPWSRELTGPWSIGDMWSAFWTTEDSRRNFTWEPSFYIERQLTKGVDAFVEYGATTFSTVLRSRSCIWAQRTGLDRPSRSTFMTASGCRGLRRICSLGSATRSELTACCGERIAAQGHDCAGLGKIP